MGRVNLKQLQVKASKACENWNGKHSVGDQVVVTKDLGEEIETITQSNAYVLSGHMAVIMLEGISGCYALERVRPA